ncbi:MAG: sugar ABC transporter permease [Trueperaceae bacterium]|nr:MAG: sugar ABC transporter permease [Trueperaceae bacterium]
MKDNAVFRGRFLAFVLLLPSLIILTIFLYYPTIQGMVLSLYRANLFLGTRRFIGLENFKSLFVGTLSPRYIQVVGQSFIFSALVVILGICLSVALATLASQKVRGARIYRLFLIWPFALSPAVAGTIFLFLFNPEVGTVNEVLKTLFGVKPRWLDTPTLAFTLVVLAAVWKNLGYNIVFYLAALQNIPAELGEAAEIDGAGPIQQFFSITFPMVSPMTFFLVFTNLTFSFFDAFGMIDIITGGGPVGPKPFDNAGLTTIMIYQVSEDGFGGSGNSGLAAALGNIILLIVATITFLQFRYGARRVQYGEN